jgi:hypothetical protein
MSTHATASHDPARILCGLVGMVALALAATDVGLYFHSFDAHDLFIAEDGLVENLTFFFSLLAGLYILATLPARTGRVHYVLIAIGLLLLAGEEISWGQRVFKIAEPASLAAVNEQHELNLHNISGIHQHVKGVGLLLILIFGVAIPVLHTLSRRVGTLIDRLRVPVFPWDGAAHLVIATVLMTVPRLVLHDNPFDEVGEMLIAVAFLTFALRQPKNSPNLFTDRKPRAA